MRRRKTEQKEITEQTENAIRGVRLFRYFLLFRFSFCPVQNFLAQKQEFTDEYHGENKAFSLVFPVCPVLPVVQIRIRGCKPI